LAGAASPGAGCVPFPQEASPMAAEITAMAAMAAVRQRGAPVMARYPLPPSRQCGTPSR
jgi:hypothetical protein